MKRIIIVIISLAMVLALSSSCKKQDETRDRCTISMELDGVKQSCTRRYVVKQDGSWFEHRNVVAPTSIRISDPSHYLEAFRKFDVEFCTKWHEGVGRDMWIAGKRYSSEDGEVQCSIRIGDNEFVATGNWWVKIEPHQDDDFFARVTFELDIEKWPDGGEKHTIRNGKMDVNYYNFGHKVEELDRVLAEGWYF